MTVAYGMSIFVPYVCAVYTCGCGRRGITHGLHAGSPPAGWEERPHGRHLCAVCCGKRAKSPQPRT